jgi:hypothetical protein
LPHHLFSSGGEPYARSDRVAIAPGSNQLQLHRIARLLKVVQIEHRRFVVGVHDQVQPAIIVEVGYRNAAAILRIVGAGRPRNVDELPASNIRKQAFVLVTVP